MTHTLSSPSPVAADRLARAQAIADRLAQIPLVRAVAVAGSQIAGLADAHSDVDLYVYPDGPIPVDTRRAIANEFAGENAPGTEIDNPFWGPEDTFADHASGLRVELIYWSPSWIEEQVKRSLVQHQASLGYTTSLWYTIWRSEPLYDRDGWFARLKALAAQPYPEPLRRAIIALNYPTLRQVVASYRHQIELAILRRDRISVNHRVAALLASYFDILFAVNHVPNPGEKRLLMLIRQLCDRVPERVEEQIEALLCGIGEPWEQQRTLERIDALLDGLDRLLSAEGLRP